MAENCLPGNPSSEWEITGAGDASIQGFATDISVGAGSTVSFKVSTDATSYRIDIYRLGYYSGAGARKVDTISPTAVLPQSQPACLNDSTTGLNDCGNWSVSASWAVPADATSGIYLARLVRTDPEDGRASHMVFIVRDDSGHSDILFQTSDITWQAYNQYGGNSLYTGSPAGRAYKVSYNRPFTTRGTSAEDWLFNSEYPMVRWLEANGYDVSYFTGVDASRLGSEILEHRIYMPVGHDEYWSGEQRANVEAARDAGVNMAFLTGNEIFWKTRWEVSNEGSATPYRTLVCYKETHANARIDPEPNVWTGTWRDPRFSPPADGGRPENALTGTIFTVNCCSYPMVVSSEEGKLRFWRNTSVASLPAGSSANLVADSVGYEWDEDLDNGARPPGLIRLSSTTVEVDQRLLDYGSNYGPGTATHHLTMYRKGTALVFGAGTVQWPWGLDDNHDRGSSSPDPRMQQASVNLLADMGVQPGTLQAGLVLAAASTDTTAPSSTIDSPSDGSSVPASSVVNITGSASDAGGGVVAAVEVSTDGGATWHPASGTVNWSYAWNSPSSGPVTLLSRAIDDSGNLGASSTAVTVSVDPRVCPCSIWSESVVPATPDANDASPIEVGVKFRAEQDGYITAIRFYKGAGNTGTHVGHLWDSAGVQLAEATFTGGTSSGWQEVSLSPAIAIVAGTTYVASYHSAGGYAFDSSYFNSEFVNLPLRALANGADGPNGVYKYGPSTFPDDTFQSSNYWVDVVFATSVAPDTTPPSVTSASPANGTVNVAVGSSAVATFNEALDASSVSPGTVSMRDASNGPVSATIAYDSSARTITLTPSSSLADSATYTVTIRGGTGGVSDAAGNFLAADYVWSFTTSGPPADEGPGGPILVISAASNPFSRYYTEILRAEGLNEFNATDISNVTPSILGSYDVAILGEMPLTAAQVSMFSDWVNAGGNLIAMRPDKQLAGLLGLTDAGSTISDEYLQVTTSAVPGRGITAQTIQFHGTADSYAPAGATVVATLFSDSTTATAYPALTVRSVGSNGGEVAAFTFDLARSVIYTRQGNPAFAAQERDGTPPIRSDDLFFGAKAGDVQPDWVDLSRVQIPQADEQQRLLANLIQFLNRDGKPLPHFWYLPRGLKAAVVMTGDDHGSNGTQGQFDKLLAQSPAGCSVSNWECLRSTSYIYTSTPLSDSSAAGYVAQGFEIGDHVTTNCADWTSQGSLSSIFDSDLGAWRSKYVSLPAPVTNRTHCIVWSDWASHPKVELAHGIRFDTNYYYWPDTWVQDRPGLFTGSGMPMRFADLDGSMIDVYQAATQMTDESGITYSTHIDTLLDNALGPLGYYGVFTMNMHTDSSDHPGANTVVAAAQSRSVPVVSAKQMLDWIDGRNASSFSNVAWAGNALTFSVVAGANTNGLQSLLPALSINGHLTGITLNGGTIPYALETVKGIDYARFSSPAGNYIVTYATDTSPPLISAVTASPNADGTVQVAWTTDEQSDSVVTYSTNPSSLDQSAADSTAVTSHQITLSGLSTSTTYYFRVQSTDAASNTAVDPNPPAAPASFTTASASFVDTTYGDFSAGTLDAQSWVTETADGEVTIRPAEGSEFNDASIPAGWSVSPWSPGGAASFAAGAMSINEALVGTDAFYAPGRALEFVASFSASNQHAGFGNDFNTGGWAIFSSKSGDQLYARVNGGSGTDVPLGAYLNAFHRFRIEWLSSSVAFYIDGVQVSSQTASLPGNLRPVFSDSGNGSGALVVQWARMDPYAGAASFRSRIFDAGTASAWGALNWTALLPPGTSLAMSVRTGNTPIPDGSWTSFSSIASPGDSIGANSRYLQYQAALTSADPSRTPEVQQVVIGYGAFSDSTPPTIQSRYPQPDAFDVPLNETVSVTFDEAMDPATISSTTVSLRADGAATDVAANVVYAGTTATLQPLADLHPGTAYTVTVSGSVSDASGNALGSDSVWTFTTIALSGFLDTTVADFAAGSPAGVSITLSGDGELTLSPAVSEDFSGSAIPLGWTLSPWNNGGDAVVANGEVTVNGGLLATSATYGPGRAIDFVATFAAEHFEHVGLGQDLAAAGESWAMFGTAGGTDTLYARTNNAGTVIDVAIPGSWLGAPHHYRIEWNSASIVFLIDGSVVHTQPVSIAANMRPVVSDYDVNASGVMVDWLRLTPYASSGVFQSRVFDALGTVSWGAMNWSATTPPQTAMDMSVRLGNTPVPDSSWTGFIPVSPSGSMIGGRSRYLQYQAELSTANDLVSPELQQVEIGFSNSPDNTPPVIVQVSPASGATSVSTAATVTVRFSEAMNSATVTSSTFSLRRSGAGTDTPASVSFSGSLATLTPNVPLEGGTLYTVTIAASVADLAGNTLGSSSQWTFTTEDTTQTFTDTLTGDFSAGTLDSHTAVAHVADGEVILAPVVHEEFDGSALPPGWTSVPWGSGGDSVVAGGVVSVNGALLGTASMYGQGRSLEFVATFSAETFQHVGFAVDFNSAVWAMFSTHNTGNAVYARVAGGAAASDVLISNSLIGSPHRYRIDWISGSVVFWVDGVVVHTESTGIVSDMRPVVSDATPNSSSVAVDWLRMSEFPASGTFQSRVFDGGVTALWKQLSWTSVLPAGTALSIGYRVGDTPVPDASWTAFAPVPASGSSIDASGRYFQYQADLSTTDTLVSPELQNVSVTWSQNGLVLIPTSTALTASPNPSTFNQDVTFTAAVSPADATGQVEFREGSGTLGSASISGGIATFVTSALSAGVHPVSAAYLGDSTHASSASPIVDQQVNAPSHSVQSLSPSSGCENGPSVTITISGLNFTSGCVAQWNGAMLPTRFLSSTQLEADVSSADMSTPGTATVTVADPFGNVSTSSAMFTVNQDTTPPAVTPPSPITVVQSTCSGEVGGSTGLTDSTLSDFLTAGGSSVDGCSASTTRLSPQRNGVDADTSTFFTAGVNTVSFRFTDASGNMGSAYSTVTVQLYGDLNLDQNADSSDLVIFSNYLVHNLAAGNPPFNAPAELSDLNLDGSVDSLDLVILSNYLVHNIGCLPLR
ncbi:MAG: N,N-dimethylformamidase beta subunit family domain-containing protein [Acidobacteriota bacterium]